MRHKKFVIICLIIGMFFAAIPLSWAGEFGLDPNYSIISFRIKHLMGYTVGIFPKFEGTIKLKDDNSALVSLEGTIDVTKLDTRHEERDEDLRSEKFFDTRKHPQAKFVSTKITRDKIIAKLTVKGVTKKVTFDYEFLGVAPDQHGNTKTAVSLKGAIKRKDFGVAHNMQIDKDTWLLGNDVELMVELHGILK